MTYNGNVIDNDLYTKIYKITLTQLITFGQLTKLFAGKNTHYHIIMLCLLIINIMQWYLMYIT